MKKVIPLILSLCMMLFCLASCNNIFETFDNHTEHTFEYIAYEETHFKQYTCGCPSPEIVEMHYDNDFNGVCDACGYKTSKFEIKWQYSDTHHWWVPEAPDGPALGVVYGYGEHENWDADLFCDICGYEIILIDPPPQYLLRDRLGCEWLCEISAENISHIKIISEAVGVAPGSPKYISTSYDEEAIAKIFESYYWLDTTPQYNYAEPDGGGAVTIQFILDDGSCREIYINNGCYCDSGGRYFELHSIPKFDETDNYVSSYGFITYSGTSTIWHTDPVSLDAEFVAQIPIDAIEFTELLDDIEFGTAESEYFIETEFADLIFVSDSCFYINGDSHTYYQLVGKTILEIIEEYSI